MQIARTACIDSAPTPIKIGTDSWPHCNVGKYSCACSCRTIQISDGLVTANGAHTPVSWLNSRSSLYRVFAQSTFPTIASDPARVNSTVPTQRTGTELRRHCRELSANPVSIRQIQYSAFHRDCLAWSRSAPACGLAPELADRRRNRAQESNQGSDQSPLLSAKRGWRFV